MLNTEGKHKPCDMNSYCEYEYYLIRNSEAVSPYIYMAARVPFT